MASFSLVTLQPEGYGHTSAFLDLKLLLYYSLKELGHEVTMATNRFPDACTALVFGAHLLDDQLRIDLPADCILFNTEQLGKNASPWSDQIACLARQYTIWDYSSFNRSELLDHQGAAKVVRLRLGHHKQLERLSWRSPQPESFIFYGSITPFREQILSRIQLSERLRISAYFGMYGWQRDGLLSRARAVLNLHSQPCRLLEWVRILPLLANAIPCIALLHPESRSDDAQLSYLLTVPEQDPTPPLEELFASPDRLQAHADAMQHRFRAQEPQVEFTQAALDATFTSGFVPAAGTLSQSAWCDSPARREPDCLWYQHVYHWIGDPRTISEFHLQEGWQRQYHPDAKFADQFQKPVWLEDAWPGSSVPPPGQRLAVVLHFHREQEARLFFAHFGRFLAQQADFYITTTCEVVSAALATLARDYQVKRAAILVISNRGRDIPSKYIYFRDQLHGYDLCLFSHGKQSSHAWFHDHNQILAGSEQRIAAIRALFQAEPSLGLVFPDYLPSLRPLIGWGNMRRQVDALLQPHGWDTRDVALLEFPAGGFFWARPAALAPIFELNLATDQLPEEPLPRDHSLLHAIERLPCLAAERAGFHWIKLARFQPEGHASGSGSGPRSQPHRNLSHAFNQGGKVPSPPIVEPTELVAGLRIDAAAPENLDPDITPLEALLSRSPGPVSLLHFHHYDSAGYLPQTWRRLLLQAQAHGFVPLITSCSGFDADALGFLAMHQLFALRRPNIGGFLGALRQVSLFAYQMLNQGACIERLLFLNDSTLPIRPTQDCLVNLVQLVNICQQERPCLGGFTESLEGGHHLQSFALVANQALLRDASWLLFWSAFDPRLQGQELVRHGEIPLSSCLSSAGVDLIALYPLLQQLLVHPNSVEELKPFANLDLARLNPTIFLAQTLSECGFCFLKKKRLSQLPLSLPLLHQLLVGLDLDTREQLSQDLLRLVGAQAVEQAASDSVDC